MWRSDKHTILQHLLLSSVGLVFELIEGALEHRPDMIRPGPGNWSCPPISKMPVMPGDMGLTMIERVLFPTDEEHSKGKQLAMSSSSEQQ